MRKLAFGLAVALACALALAGGARAEAVVDQTGEWRYRAVEGGAEIAGRVDSPAGDLEIPAELDGLPVVAIGDMAFKYSDKLRSIRLPEGVGRVGELAFVGCSGLVAAELPESLTELGGLVFEGCHRLASITLPSRLTEFGANPFVECGLLRLEVSPENPTLYLADGALFSESAKAILAFPSAYEGAYSIPEGVTDVWGYAFARCAGLTSVELPEGVTRIGDLAFSRCAALTAVALPDGLERIEFAAFRGCGGLASLSIPDSVTAIGRLAFEDCPELTLIVGKGSYAEGYAEENEVPYALAG